MAAQIDEDSNIVFFKGVLTSSEFLKIIDNKQLNNDEIALSIDSFKGGIERLFRFVRLLDSNAINRLSINSKSNVIIWEKLRRKIIMQKVTPKDFTNLHNKLSLLEGILSVRIISGGDREHQSYRSEN